MKRATVFQEQKSKMKSLSGCVLIHWDGKIVEEDGVKVDRLPVIASTKGDSQLLGIPKLASGTGQAQAEAVVNAVRNWSLEDRTGGLVFDTTGSNTGGGGKGFFPRIEKFLGKDLLRLACRHHTTEIIIRGVYETFMGSSKAPEDPLFTAFQKQWDKLDQSYFTPGLLDKTVARALRSEDTIVEFARAQIEVG